MDTRKAKRGFTLVGLIVVLVILALLAALLVPALTGYIDKARKSQVIAETRMLHTAIQTEMSELYAKPEWQGYVPTIDGREIIAGKNAADANKANRYNDIVDLSELSSLTADGKGAFGAYVTDTGKVGLLVYYDGKGHVGVYLAQTQEYLSFSTEEAPDYSAYIFQGVQYIKEYLTDPYGVKFYNTLLEKATIIGTICG